MANPELQQAWAEHTAAESAAARERREWYADIKAGRERAKVAAERVNEITNVIGFSHSGGPLYDVYDVRISSPVPVGKLEDDGSSEVSNRKFAFAKVFVFRDKKTIERRVKGLFFHRIEYDKVATDTVANVGVAFFAGTEDGRDLVRFRESNWSITASDDLDKISSVESDLDLVASALGLSSNSEKPTA